MKIPAHVPSETTRSEVAALASFGVPQEDIAAYIGISHVTLRKHYSEELGLSAIKANATVGKYLFSLASGQAIKNGATHSDCKTAAMFWAKTRMKWRETSHHDHTSSDGSMTPKAAIDVSVLSTEALAEIVAAANAAGSGDD